VPTVSMKLFIKILHWLSNLHSCCSQTHISVGVGHVSNLFLMCLFVKSETIIVFDIFKQCLK